MKIFVIFFNFFEKLGHDYENALNFLEKKRMCSQKLIRFLCFLSLSKGTLQCWTPCVWTKICQISHRVSKNISKLCYFSVKILHLKESLIGQCLHLLLDLLDRNRKSISEGLQFWILPNGILPLVSIPQHLGMPQDSIILQDIHSLIEVKFLISIFRYSCSNNLRYLSTIFF